MSKYVALLKAIDAKLTNFGTLKDNVSMLSSLIERRKKQVQRSCRRGKGSVIIDNTFAYYFEESNTKCCNRSKQSTKIIYLNILDHFLVDFQNEISETFSFT